MKRITPSAKPSLILSPFLLILISWPANADVPMYLVIAYTKYVYWWTIPLAIAIEAFAISWIFSIGYTRATIYSIAVNTVTAILGIGLYPTIATFIISADIDAQFTIVQLIKLIVFITVIDTGIELLVLRYAFRLNVLGKNGWYFLIANVVTTAMIFIVVSM